MFVYRDLTYNYMVFCNNRPPFEYNTISKYFNNLYSANAFCVKMHKDFDVVELKMHDNTLDEVICINVWSKDNERTL